MKPYMTLKTYIVLTALALPIPQLAIGQGNLVFNGGFDTDASGWILTNVFAGAGYQPTFGNPPGSVSLFSLLSFPAPSSASQTITNLTPGVIYIVSGDYQKVVGKDITDNSFGVALDGVFFFETGAPTSTNWYSFNFEYTAASTTALLTLSARINGADFSYLIDNISMEAVPEPSSLWLIGIGGIASAMFLRYRGKIWLKGFVRRHDEERMRTANSTTLLGRE